MGPEEERTCMECGCSVDADQSLCGDCREFLTDEDGIWDREFDVSLSDSADASWDEGDDD